jgi:Cytochrome C oxidase, cbb3-type, subunit III
MSKLRVKTEEGVLVDDVRESPVDKYEYRFRRWWLLSILLVIVVVVASLVAYFTADSPVEYSNIVDHFKYGSVGSEPGGSIFEPQGGMLPPYWIFKELPKICPEKLPGGYASKGFLYEEGRDLPIGVSRRFRLGLDQVGLNCAFCHTGTVRGSPDEKPRIIPGMPAHQMELQGFLSFLTTCSLDPRLTAKAVIAAAKEDGETVPFMQRMILSRSIDQVKAQSVVLQGQLSLLLQTPIPWGRGRVDTFNPYKAIQLNWDLSKLPPEELIGAADYPQLWNQGPREGMHLHFDGNNTSVAERNLSAALGAGVVPTTVDYDALYRIRDWIKILQPPKYPWPIDSAKADRGHKLYEQNCASCHEFGAAKVGTVEPIESVNTDPYRMNAYTYIFSTNQWALYPESPNRVTHFRKTYGYANQPLDGVWLRAPYLHNGSVPTMWDLLMPPKDRPVRFYRGYDVFDQKNMGFITQGPEAEKAGTLYDTTRPGNGNQGHLWGTTLSPGEKWDLLEYMKTL